MKRFTLNITLAVAALTIAAGTISAQTLKAEIPFAFRVGKQVMQPGEYRVSLQRGSSGTPLLTLANLDVNRSVILMPYLSGDVPKAWSEAGLPKLRFLCGEGPCTITGVWTGEGDAYEFHYSRGKDGELRAAEIVLRPDRAN